MIVIMIMIVMIKMIMMNNGQFCIIACRICFNTLGVTTIVSCIYRVMYNSEFSNVNLYKLVTIVFWCLILKTLWLALVSYERLITNVRIVMGTAMCILIYLKGV